jgi:hypothetical protein
MSSFMQEQAGHNTGQVDLDEVQRLYERATGPNPSEMAGARVIVLTPRLLAELRAAREAILSLCIRHLGPDDLHEFGCDQCDAFRVYDLAVRGGAMTEQPTNIGGPIDLDHLTTDPTAYISWDTFLRLVAELRAAREVVDTLTQWVVLSGMYFGNTPEQGSEVGAALAAYDQAVGGGSS